MPNQATRPLPGGGTEKRWQAQVDGRTRITWAQAKTAAAAALGVSVRSVKPAPPDWRNESRGGTRSTRLAVRVSAAEKASIVERARAAGKSLPDWIVHRCG